MSLIKWEVKKRNHLIPDSLASEYVLSPLLKKALEARGITDGESISRALRADGAGFHSPFLLADMDKAVGRITDAIYKGEKITVYGDYDVDGITSVYTLSSYLKSRGANVSTYIPEREGEGYGINKDAVLKLVSDGTKLMVTVDSGITASEEIAFAMSNGLDVVVTDHHEPGKALPVCSAVVDPRREDCAYPFKELAGVGVVFKLICAMEGGSDSVFEKYGDMVALGTIADVMSITDENKTIVSKGLNLIENTKNLGLRALIKASCAGGMGVSAVGYRLAPRINAAGRMSSASEALALLLSETEDRAENAAAALCALNKLRQDYEAEIFASAVDMIESDRESFLENRGIVLYDKAWKQGVVGIVASRLAEKYGLPVVMITVEDGVGKGSARSVEGFNIFSAISRAIAGLGSCGGHQMAAGLRLPEENIGRFREAFYTVTRAELPEGTELAPLKIDCEITPSDISEEYVKDLSRLEPYGAGNPQPVFCLRGARLSSITPIGEGKHTRLALEKDGHVLAAVYFGKEADKLPYCEGDRVDAAFSLEINVYRGCSSVRLTVKDIRPEEAEVERAETAMREFRALTEAGAVETAGRLRAPDRTACAAVWNAIKSLGKKGGLRATPALLYKNLRRLGYSGGELSMMVTLRAFYESGLLSGLKLGGDDFYGEMTLTFNSEAPAKVDLTKTVILSRLA